MSVDKEAWIQSLRAGKDPMLDKIEELSGSYGIVADYLTALHKSRKYPSQSRKYLEMADRALDSMTGKAADLALKLAGELDLPWDLLTKVDVGMD